MAALYRDVQANDVYLTQAGLSRRNAAMVPMREASLPRKPLAEKSEKSSRKRGDCFISAAAPRHSLMMKIIRRDIFATMVGGTSVKWRNTTKSSNHLKSAACAIIFSINSNYFYVNAASREMRVTSISLMSAPEIIRVNIRLEASKNWKMKHEP